MHILMIYRFFLLSSATISSKASCFQRGCLFGRRVPDVEHETLEVGELEEDFGQDWLILRVGTTRLGRLYSEFIEQDV